MHVNCVICGDLFVPSSDVFVTRCGHLFHYPCLSQWIERSKSCPQCRHVTTEKTIHRIYFNVATNDTEEDSGLLHNKIDSLTFQLRLKDLDIKNASEENAKVKDQNSGLRCEIIKLEETIHSLKATIASFKDQIRYLKAQNESAEAAIEETRKLRKHLETLKSVETIVQGSVAEVDDILNQHGDSYESRKSLATYVSVLKREVQGATEKKKELREKLRKRQRDLSLVNTEKERLIEKINTKSNLCKQLEEDFQHIEKENKSLQKKIRDLEKAISSPNGTNPRDSALRRLILESPMPEAVKRPRLSDPSQADTSSSLSFTLDTKSPDPKSQVKSQPSTQGLNMKSCSIGTGPLGVSQTSNLKFASGSNKYSIFKKRQTESNTVSANRGEAYDGMGGHSKLDAFPVPVPRSKSSTNMKNRTNSMKKPSSTTKLTFFNN